MNTEIDLTKFGKIGSKLVRATIRVFSVILIFIIAATLSIGPIILSAMKGSMWYSLFYIPIAIIIVAFYEEIVKFFL